MVRSPDGSHHEIHHSGPKYRGHWECHYYPVAGNKDPFSLAIQYWLPPITPIPGDDVGLYCVDQDGVYVYSSVYIYDPANPFGGLELPERAADEARKLLPLGPPSVALAPPATTAQLVGVPTWFWITDPWQPLQASATLDGVTATVAATPTTLTFRFADGTTLTCDGPGTAYDPTRDAASQQSNCTHTFERRGDDLVTATVTYTTRWTATTGDAGDLDDVTRTAVLPVTVVEAQALIR